MSRNVVVAYVGTEGAQAALALRPEASLWRNRRSGQCSVRTWGAAIAAVSPDLLDERLGDRGPAGPGVVTVAEDIGADLIVTGSRARGRLTRAVLGSLSTDILHQAPCDVLVVHPPD